MYLEITISRRKEAVMKVQCPECKVGYNLDEKKLPAKGAYVRCRKCQHRFFIKKEKLAETTTETIECPRCKLPQEGIEECQHCGFVFQEKLKTKKTFPSKNLHKNNLTNCRFCKEPISRGAEICPYCKKIQINKRNMFWVGIAATFQKTIRDTNE